MWSTAGGRAVGSGTGEPVVRLLPRFDDYLLGWRGRDLILDRRFARRVQAGGGWIHAAVVVDGRVAGTWRSQRASRRQAGPGPPGLPDQLAVVIEPFERLGPKVLPGLEAEAADLGRFLGVEVSLRLDGR
jgi:hypothetical protein